MSQPERLLSNPIAVNLYIFLARHIARDPPEAPGQTLLCSSCSFAPNTLLYKSLDSQHAHVSRPLHLATAIELQAFLMSERSSLWPATLRLAKKKSCSAWQQPVLLPRPALRKRRGSHCVQVVSVPRPAERCMQKQGVQHVKGMTLMHMRCRNRVALSSMVSNKG